VHRPLVVVSGGGTGGHLYPALAIADALRDRRPDVRVIFVGARKGIEATVLPQRGEAHLLLPVHGVDRSRPLTSWRAVTGLLSGLVRVGRLFQRERPDVVVVTGGYAGAAAGIVAGLMGVPLVLQEQNSFPGAVTKLLTRFAARVHVAYPEAIDRLPVARERCVVSGNPVRARSEKSRSEARDAFGVPEEVKLTLVTGGSQGSLALNRAVTAYVQGVEAEELTRASLMHLLWATGRKHFDAVDAALSALERPDWVHALPYVEDMPGAMAASDIALCRAGAMTIAELLNEGLPSILVPLPTSAEDHQMYNARALEAAGAARVVPESELTPARLAVELKSASSGTELLASMRAAARERARPEATSVIARDVATFLPPLRRAA